MLFNVVLFKLAGNRSTVLGDRILSSLSIPPSTHMAITTEPMVYHIQPATVTILSQHATGQLSSEAIIVTDYTEVELSSNEIAEESIERSLNSKSSSVIPIPSDDPVAEEEDIITISEHDDFYKALEGNTNSETEKSFCEKATQYDIIEELGLTCHDDQQAPVLNEAASMEDSPDVESEKTVLEQKESDEIHLLSQKDNDQPNSSPVEANSLTSAAEDQVAPTGRRRGRPRKNTVARKVVQNGRRRGRPASLQEDNNTEKE